MSTTESFVERARRGSSRIVVPSDMPRERSVSAVGRDGEEEDLLLKELYNYSYVLPPINPEQRRKYRRKRVPLVLVTVQQARDLIATDHSGFADPVRFNSIHSL
jgi:hypothetical protein